jgi:hypothetical protein
MLVFSVYDKDVIGRDFLGEVRACAHGQAQAQAQATEGAR